MKCFFVAIALVLIWLAPAHAAVAFDAKSATSCSSATSPATCPTFMTVGTITNGVLAIFVNYNANAALTGSSVTWNGSSATLVGNQHSGGATSAGTAIFCLKAPAAGSNTLVVSITATSLNEIHAIAASFSGADQTTPCKNYNSTTDQVATTASVTVTSAVGDIPAAVQAQSDVNVNSVNGTPILIDNTGPTNSISGNYGVGAASVSLTATGSGSATWQSSGIDIAAASGGGATINERTMMGVGQ